MNLGVDANLGYLGERARLLRDTFARFGVEYMFIGKGAALAQGFPGTTRDLDIFPAKRMDNRRKLLEAAANFKVVIDGYPLLSIGGIITSKRHANRPKDQQDIPLLEEFRKYLEAVKDES